MQNLHTFEHRRIAHDFHRRAHRAPWRPHVERERSQSLAVTALIVLGMVVLALWVIEGGAP